MNQLCRYSYPFPHYNPCPRPTFNTCNLAHSDGKEHFGQVFVKTKTGKTNTIEFESVSTILDIKNKFREREGIPVNQMKLMKREQSGNLTLLSNNIPIGHYGIKDGDTLIIELCLRPCDPPPAKFTEFCC